jgi:spectinomycin phosphotransferase
MNIFSILLKAYVPPGQRKFEQFQRKFDEFKNDLSVFISFVAYLFEHILFYIKKEIIMPGNNNSQIISEQRVISKLKNCYGIDVKKIISLPLGADVNALIYKVQTPDQKTYFIKLKRGHHDISASLQLLLHEAGIKEIISPIKTLDKQPKLDIDDFTLIVYPFIDGNDGFSQILTDDQWITFGKALKHIHQFQLPASISSLIKWEDYSPEWRNKIRSMYEYNHDVKPSDEIASKFLAFLKNHKLVIESLVDRAEKLSHGIQEQSIDFVLCHGDIHAGNVLIATHGALYIVDWDQPIMAPKERDLMFIGAGVGNVWNKKREIELFYRGYGKTEIHPKIIDYYRCERIIQDIVEYNQQLLSDNGGYKNRLTSYNNFIAMFEPGGVVDIALQTKIK